MITKFNINETVYSINTGTPNNLPISIHRCKIDAIYITDANITYTIADIVNENDKIAVVETDNWDQAEQYIFRDLQEAVTAFNELYVKATIKNE